MAGNGASLEPARHPWMGAGKVIEWIAFRGTAEPAGIEEGKGALMLAERALVDLAGRGLVRAMGVAGTTSAPKAGVAEVIEAEAFRAEDVGVTLAGELGLRLPVPLERLFGTRAYRGPRFHRVEFATADVLREWPASVDVALNPTTPVQPGPPRIKPPFTRAACEIWFKLFVGTWKSTGAPPPSEDACLAAAKDYFAGRRVPRDRFREIRRVSVPQTWLKTGPRGPRKSSPPRD